MSSSSQGWNWVVAANSNPFSEQGWPANYSGGGPSRSWRTDRLVGIAGT